ncbi:hypothetical protein, partial [Priestia megaterium]|uniref:hypothetical protein n=1 Tax=Priestia megaterium TaxID=1404 RepID=UPI00372D8097
MRSWYQPCCYNRAEAARPAATGGCGAVDWIGTATSRSGRHQKRSALRLRSEDASSPPSHARRHAPYRGRLGAAPHRTET